VREDGLPLPLGAVIERVCGGRVRKEAIVGPEGYFSFQVGGGREPSIMIPEASDDSRTELDMFGSRSARRFALPSGMDSMSSTNLIGCELRARLGGYRSSVIVLDGAYTSGQMEVGTIVLHPIAKVQGTTVSATNLAAPKLAKKAFEQANAALRKSNFEAAAQNLQTAVASYPNYAEAWFKLGQVYQQLRQNQNARQAFAKAIEADSNYVNPYIQLARLAGQEKNWVAVADITDRALALDPLDFPEGYFLNSLAYYSLEKLDIAERSARRVLRLDSSHRLPQIHLLLANILREKQDIAGTIEQLRNYLKYAPTSAYADRIRSQIQELEQPPKGNPETGLNIPR
jgi:tetratricopeptide (TPR) repeat protein